MNKTGFGLHLGPITSVTNELTDYLKKPVILEFVEVDVKLDCQAMQHLTDIFSSLGSNIVHQKLLWKTEEINA